MSEPITAIDHLMDLLKKSSTTQITQEDIEIEKAVQLLGEADYEARTTAETKKISAELFSLILQEWQAWKTRTAVYTPLIDQADTAIAQFNHPYKKFQALNSSAIVQQELKKLTLNLLAFQEQPNGTTYDEIKLILLSSMLARVLKLKLIQMELLEQSHHVGLMSIQHEDKLLEHIRKNIRHAIEHRKNRLSESLKKEFEHTNQFFKQSKKLHFKKHLGYSKKVKAGYQFAGSSFNLVTKIGTLVPTLARGLASAGHLLTALPFISQFISAYPHLIKFIKSWIKRKEKIQLIGASLTLAVLVGGAIASGLVVAASAFIALGTICYVTIITDLIPFISTYKKLKARKNLILECDNDLKKSNPFPLSSIQKHILLLKLEQHLEKMTTSESSNLTHQLAESKKIIATSNSWNEITNNTLLKESLPIEALKNPPTTLDEYMRSQVESYKHIVQDDMLLLKNKLRLEMISLTSGIITVTAAILLCIPTPITFIFAASLFLVSATINIGLEFNWFNKTQKTIEPNRTPAKQTAIYSTLNHALSLLNIKKPALQSKKELTPALTNEKYTLSKIPTKQPDTINNQHSENNLKSPKKTP